MCAFSSTRIIAGRRLVPVLVLHLLAADELRDDPVAAVVDVGVALGRARDDERRPGLVDQDRVDLVDDRVDVPPLDHLGDLELHVVAQVVEAELVVRPVGDVLPVGLAPRLVVHVVLDAADGQPEEAVDPAHPLRVALGEVVVHGDDVDAPAGQGVQRDGKRRDERLPFAGPHLGDLPLVEDHAPHQLDVVVALLERPFPRLPDDREDLDELGFEELPNVVPPLLQLFGERADRFLDAAPDLGEPGPEGVVGEGGDIGLEGVDLGDARPEGLDVALVLRSEDLGECFVDDHE